MSNQIELTEAAPPIPLSLALKQATSELHTRAEKHPIQAKLVRGGATRADYTAFLAQMAAVHAHLEPELRTLATTPGPMRDTVKSHHYRADAARQDLSLLGWLPQPHSTVSATVGFCERIRAWKATNPLALLGVVYVLEGATNGGQFIAAAVRTSLELPQGAGTAYLDPHGHQQRERWTAFRASLDEQEFGAQDRDAIISAACETFAAIYEILEELHRSSHVDG